MHWNQHLTSIFVMCIFSDFILQAIVKLLKQVIQKIRNDTKLIHKRVMWLHGIQFVFAAWVRVVNNRLSRQVRPSTGRHLHRRLLATSKYPANCRFYQCSFPAKCHNRWQHTITTRLDLRCTVSSLQCQRDSSDSNSSNSRMVWG